MPSTLTIPTPTDIFSTRQTLKGRKNVKDRVYKKEKLVKCGCREDKLKAKRAADGIRSNILPCHGGRKNLIFLLRSEETGFPDQNNEIFLSLAAVKPVRWCHK
jgi:hypothetical protein